jgi:acetyl esterase/lipase
MRLYAGAEDLRHPHISPLFAELGGLPPTLLATGTRDLLLSDSVRMHRALLDAGVEAELHVWEAAGHGNFMRTAPEDDDRARQIRTFAERCWTAGDRRREPTGRPGATG